MQFFPTTCQFLEAHYIREWSRGRPREIKSSRKKERTIFPERRQGISRPCELLSEIYSGIGKTTEPLNSLMNKSNKF